MKGKKIKKKSLFIYLILGVLYVVLSIFTSNLLANYKLGLKEVYVAAYNIPSRTKLSKDYLKKIKLPSAYLNEGICNDLSYIENAYVKNNLDIPEGSLIYYDYLDQITNMQDLSLLELKDGQASFDLFVKDIKVNPAIIAKNMKVDLYVTINKQVVISDLLIGNALITGLYDVNNKEIKTNSKDAKLQTISIAIDKEMVPILNKALVLGEISIVLTSDLYSNAAVYLNECQALNYLK